MIKVEYPNYQPRVKEENGREMIFDPYRKRWVTLSPEEWVRQNFIEYLVNVLLYPSSLIAVEKEIILGDVKKRFDILIYKHSIPVMVVECKSMNEVLGTGTFNQVLRYNTNLQAKYVVITNGSYCYAFRRTGDHFEETHLLPAWDNL